MASFLSFGKLAFAELSSSFVIHLLIPPIFCKVFRAHYGWTLRKKCPYSELFWSAFSAFELNTERYWVSLRIQSECEKMWTGITPNTDTLHAVEHFYLHWCSYLQHTLLSFVTFTKNKHIWELKHDNINNIEEKHEQNKWTALIK